MTTKNLNKGLVSILTEQYESDYTENLPYPIRYILHDNRFGQDIVWEIRQKIEPETFKQVLRNYFIARRDQIEYETDIFKASPRVPHGQHDRADPDAGDFLAGDV